MLVGFSVTFKVMDPDKDSKPLPVYRLAPRNQKKRKYITFTHPPPII